jgi:Tfp pilus assembly protein PilV
MGKNSGFTLLEVLIAAMIFVLVVGASVTTLISITALSKEFEYRYTALNLAREVLEFGEASQFAHPFKMKYYYPPATVCTIPGGCDNDAAGCRKGLEPTEGYGLKEWYFFCSDNPHPFMSLGDIKEKKLVPKKAPDSVVIYYAVEVDGVFGGYRETVEVTWQEDLGGETKKEVLSVIPIREVNDQLQLNTAEFWWE